MHESEVERVARTTAKLGITEVTLHLLTGQRTITRNDGNVIDDRKLIVVTTDITHGGGEGKRVSQTRHRFDLNTAERRLLSIDQIRGWLAINQSPNRQLLVFVLVVEDSGIKAHASIEQIRLHTKLVVICRLRKVGTHSCVLIETTTRVTQAVTSVEHHIVRCLVARDDSGCCLAVRHRLATAVTTSDNNTWRKLDGGHAGTEVERIWLPVEEGLDAREITIIRCASRTHCQVPLFAKRERDLREERLILVNHVVGLASAAVKLCTQGRTTQGTSRSIRRIKEGPNRRIRRHNISEQRHVKRLVCFLFEPIGTHYPLDRIGDT